MFIKFNNNNKHKPVLLKRYTGVTDVGYIAQKVSIEATGNFPFLTLLIFYNRYTFYGDGEVRHKLLAFRRANAVNKCNNSVHRSTITVFYLLITARRSQIFC